MGTITDADLTDLARGAAVLGAGGGGDPHIGLLMARQALAEHGPVRTVPLGEVPDDAHVVPVAMMGAPTVMVEKLPSPDQVRAVVHAQARYRGRAATHIACIEAGGVNSTIPIVAAAQLGLPLINGDGMGRAFPELQMVLPTVYGRRATPMSIADEKGNHGVFDTVSNLWAERLARTATVEMGCSTLTSTFAMSGAQAKESFVAGTLSRCRRLGQAITAARAGHQDPVAALTQALGGRVLAHGKVTDVQRATTAGFARGEAVISGSGGDAGHQLVLRFQNENLIAEYDRSPVVTTPDLIIVVDRDTGEPITTEALRFGNRVAVLGAPADPRWHEPAGIALAGPRYFGYPIDPVRVHPDARREARA